MAENHSLHELQAPGSSKVFVQRDYSSGTTCRFHTKFPSELENRVDKQQFEETMQMLNNLYAEAEKLGGRSYLEGCLSCLTAYTAFLCLQTHYEKVDKQQFEETMQMLNNLYAEAEKLGGRSYLEGCLSCLTAYTAFLCLQTHYEKVLKKISRFIKDQNEKIYAPRGLLLTDPMERGLRVVEITIFEDRSVGSS